MHFCTRVRVRVRARVACREIELRDKCEGRAKGSWEIAESGAGSAEDVERLH